MFEENSEQMQAYAAMSDALMNGLTDGIIEFTETGKMNFKAMALSIIQDLIAIQIQSSMMSLFSGMSGGMSGGLSSLIGSFAKGAAFDNGNVTAFAKGGVVSSPTVFPMANGMGLMGEAGAESVMPLTRTSNGDLGITAKQSPVNINVNNYGNDNVDVQQNGDTIDIIISQIANGITRGTNAVGTAIENRYSLQKT